jgi:hypothetical protein
MTLCIVTRQAQPNHLADQILNHEASAGGVSCQVRGRAMKKLIVSSLAFAAAVSAAIAPVLRPRNRAEMIKEAAILAIGGCLIAAILWLMVASLQDLMVAMAR